jgi:hypothetical protein
MPILLVAIIQQLSNPVNSSKEENPVQEKYLIEHIELPANLLDHFLRSDSSNINQAQICKNRLRICLVASFELRKQNNRAETVKG